MSGITEKGGRVRSGREERKCADKKGDVSKVVKWGVKGSKA